MPACANQRLRGCTGKKSSQEAPGYTSGFFWSQGFLTIESWPEVTPTFCYLLTSFLLLLHFEALKTMLLLLCLIPCVCVCPGVFVPVNVLPAEARKDCWS